MLILFLGAALASPPTPWLSPELADGFTWPEGAQAVARGRVVSVERDPVRGGVVLIRHDWLENGSVDTVYSVTSRLARVDVAPGEPVERGARLGAGEPEFELRLSPEQPHAALWADAPAGTPVDFVTERAELLVPAEAPALLVVHKSDYSLVRYAHGRLVERIPVALSQEPRGHKQRRGDNRLPEGLYHIIQKSRGPFDGAVAPYFGVAWLRLDYPNPWDAEAGVRVGTIDEAERDRILDAHRRGAWPPRDTALGSGIGIHGWAGDWSLDGDRDLTWGCLSVRNGDLDRLYAQVDSGTPVLIFP